MLFTVVTGYPTTRLKKNGEKIFKWVFGFFPHFFKGRFRGKNNALSKLFNIREKSLLPQAIYFFLFAKNWNFAIFHHFQPNFSIFSSLRKILQNIPFYSVNYAEHYRRQKSDLLTFTISLHVLSRCMEPETVVSSFQYLLIDPRNFQHTRNGTSFIISGNIVTIWI